MGEEFEPTPPEVGAVASRVIDAAMQVHRTLGPGLLEAVYEACLCHEFAKRGIAFERQCAWPIVYGEVRLDAGLRFDMLVEQQVTVELKAVDRMTPLFDARLLTYLKLSGMRLGLLINFSVPLLKHGIKRLVL